MAHQELRLQRQAVVRDVKQLYYGILQTLSGIEALDVTLQSYRELDAWWRTMCGSKRP